MERCLTSTNSFMRFLKSSEFSNSDKSYKQFDGEEQKQSVTPPKKRCIRKMWIAALAVLCQSLATGLVSGFSAPAQYDMTHNPHSVINPTDKEQMWIGSVVVLGFILGGMIAGPMADKIGRKDTLVYNIVLFGLGWIVIIYAETVAIVILGRFINGLAIGVIGLAVPLYCVEIATNDARGIIGSAPQGFLVIGNLISVLLGAVLSWKYLAVNGAVFAILSVIVFIPMPESPRWLLMKKDLKGAVEVMRDLHGNFINAEKECQVIYDDLQNQPDGNVTWAELIRPASVKPGIIATLVMFFQMFSGMNAVFIYSSKIFEVSADFLDPKVGTIILGAVQVVVTLFSNVIVDKSGRKILLILSGILMGGSFAIFGYYYYMLTIDANFEQKYGWLPLACCIVAVIGYSIGYGPVPGLLSAEMFPLRVRSTLGAIVHVAAGIFAFLVMNLFADMEDAFQKHGTFWFYSIVSAIGVAFVILFVPETKGKSILEIEEIFNKKKKNIQVMNISVISKENPQENMEKGVHDYIEK